MPLYEYRCAKCAHVEEVLHKVSDVFTGTCPACGHAVMERLVSRTSFRLTGSGWYETDFKNTAKTTTAADTKKDGAKTNNDTKGDTTTPKSNDTASASTNA